MLKFHVGQRVRWTRLVEPDHMKQGTVVRVIPHPDLPGDLNEYDVEFRHRTVRLYERQLKAIYTQGGRL